MTTWKQASQRALYSGGAAAVLSALALAICGKLERNSPGAPLNGPSQWVWGTPAAYRRGASFRHTVLGYCIHHVASVGWATVHEKHFASRLRGTDLLPHLVAGAVTATLACIVDFRVARGRMQPGFDKQLSRASLALVYMSFGLGLAMGCTSRAMSPRSRPPACQAPGE
jgi:hypothetical protein